MILLEQLDIHSGKFEDIFKYADDDDVYISFTDIPFKSGINPRSKYGTPIGIYCYQLMESIRYYKVTNKENKFPFASDRKYINILKSHANVSIAGGLMYSRAYNKYNFDKDLKTLKEWGEKNSSHKIGKLINDNINSAIENYEQDARVKIPMGYMWYILYHISESSIIIKKSIVWNFLLNKILGYVLIRDDGEGIIHPNEPMQSVFLTTRSFDIIDIIKNTQTSDENSKTFHRLFKLLIKSIKMNNIDNINKIINIPFLNSNINFVKRIVSNVLSDELMTKYENVKRLILGIGINKFISLNIDVENFSKKIYENINQLLLTHINTIEVSNLSILLTDYEIPVNLLIKRFGKTALNNFFMSTAYQNSPDKYKFKLINYKNGRYINDIVSAMGVDEFSKMLIDLSQTSHTNYTKLIKLIATIDIAKRGLLNRGSYKISSIFDVTNDEFKNFITNQIIKYRLDLLYILTNQDSIGEVKLFDYKIPQNFISFINKLRPKLTNEQLAPIFQAAISEWGVRNKNFIDLLLYLLYGKGVIKLKPHVKSLFAKKNYQYEDFDWDYSKL